MQQIIKWLGHGSWYMQTCAGTEIFLDPWLDNNPACKVKLDDITSADMVCVTHGHDDHLGDAIALVKKTGAVLVTTPEIAIYCEKHGIPYDDRGGCAHVGGCAAYRDVVVRFVNALHGAGIMGCEYLERKEVLPGPGTVGMVIESQSGKSVYFAGDTGLFSDMALIGKLYAPQVCVLPIGGKYTMGVREAAYAMEILRCDVMIPGHYNTFENQKADIDDLLKHASVRSPRTKVEILEPGQSLIL